MSFKRADVKICGESNEEKAEEKSEMLKQLNEIGI